MICHKTKLNQTKLKDCFHAFSRFEVLTTHTTRSIQKHCYFVIWQQLSLSALNNYSPQAPSEMARDIPNPTLEANSAESYFQLLPINIMMASAEWHVCNYNTVEGNWIKLKSVSDLRNRSILPVEQLLRVAEYWYKNLQHSFIRKKSGPSIHLL